MERMWWRSRILLCVVLLWCGCALDPGIERAPPAEEGMRVNGGDVRAQMWLETQDGATATTSIRVGVYRPGLLTYEEEETIETLFQIVTWPEGMDVPVDVRVVHRVERNGDWRLYEISALESLVARWHALIIHVPPPWLQVIKASGLQELSGGALATAFRPDSMPMPLRAQVCQKESESDMFAIRIEFSEALRGSDAEESATVLDLAGHSSLGCRSTIVASTVHVSCPGVSHMGATRISLNSGLRGISGSSLTPGDVGSLEYDLLLKDGVFNAGCWSFEL